MDVEDQIGESVYTVSDVLEFVSPDTPWTSIYAYAIEHELFNYPEREATLERLGRN